MNDIARPWHIYSLSDPHTGFVRYIGVTFRGINKRFIEHMSRARKMRRTHRDCWIYSLIQLGLKPHLSIVEAGQGVGWQEQEKYWIGHYRTLGPLVNLTDGGDGTPGTKPSEKCIAAVRAAHLGVPYPPGRRSAMLGKHHSREVCEKIRKASAGRRHSPEVCAKIARAAKGRDMTRIVALSVAARTGVPLSSAHRANIAATTTNRKAIVCVATGETFPSITAAARHLRVTEASVSQSVRKGCQCKGRRFTFLLR